MRKPRTRRMPNPEQYVGQVFNGITILSIIPQKEDDLEQSCICKCHCGKEFQAPVWRVVREVQKSCGTCGSGKPVRPIRLRHDLTGERFGELEVLSVAGRNTQNRITYLCRCTCGNTTIVAANNLTSGNTRSCGRCNYAREQTVAATRIYATADEAWLADSAYGDMRRRCYDPNFPEYVHYGAKGITMCEEWKNSPKAYVYWCICNGWRPGMTVDRIDNNGPYAPWNCRIADKIQQANNKSNNRRITVNGETHTLAEWSRLSGVTYSIIRNRTDERIAEIISEALAKKSS